MTLRTTEIKLEIGGGINNRDGYINCEIRKLNSTNIQCAADNLPFKDSTVDEIYSRHFIEHLSLNDFLKVLEEWNRVLKMDGIVYIICPNLIWHIHQILDSKHKSLYIKTKNENHRYWAYGSLFGWQQDEYDFHKFGYYFELLNDILSEFSFEEIKNLTNTTESLEQAPWHLEVSAKKKGDSIKYSNSMIFNHFSVFH